MVKELKYKEMVTMQAGGLLLTRHSETLYRASQVVILRNQLF